MMPWSKLLLLRHRRKAGVILRRIFNLASYRLRSYRRGDEDEGSSIPSAMIRKLKSGQYRLYSRKKDESGKRRNLGTFPSQDAAKQHEREVQYFKKH